jgi:hypothetical protein
MALGRDARTRGARRTRYGVLSLSGIRRDQVVGRQSEEFRETRRFDRLAEEVGRVVVAADVSGCFAQLREFLVEHRTAVPRRRFGRPRAGRDAGSIATAWARLISAVAASSIAGCEPAHFAEFSAAGPAMKTSL